MNIKKDRNIVRNVKFNCSLSKNESGLLNKLSRDLKISKTELIVRALTDYNKRLNE